MTFNIRDAIKTCDICTERFSKTHTAHVPKPVVWFQPNARLLIAGQAPGMRVYKTQKPFTDPSGDRLRAWLGLSEHEFYDMSRIAIVPMAFCFPGYNDKGADLPPPSICARTWHKKVEEALPNIKVRIIIGGYAQRWHLGTKTSVTETVKSWQKYAPSVYPLPHPSWRNTAWLKKNPWFEDMLLPELRQVVRKNIEA